MSTASTTPAVLHRPMAPAAQIRIAAAAVAGIVALDVFDVRAPFLSFVAIPFVIGALALRKVRGIGGVLLGLWSLLFVVLGLNFAAANKFDAGWGDLLFAYAGTPASLFIVVSVVRAFLARRPSER